ncbi:MAG: M28 family peptidase [Anaerolineales bacterium]
MTDEGDVPGVHPMARPEVRILLGCLPCLLAGAGCVAAPRPAPRLESGSLRFSGEIALAIVEEYATRFTRRHSGMPNNLAAAQWFGDELRRAGWECALDSWPVVNHSRAIAMHNEVCTLAGRGPRSIVVVAHHDQSPETVQGADNDGSGISILVHLGQIFGAESPPAHTLVFVSTDGEEYGMLGARRYLRTHPAPERILAAVSLDNLGKRWSNGLKVETIGQFRGTSPLWLLLTAQAAAAAAGEAWAPAIDPPLFQALSQAVPISFMDQGPFVAAGVPALGLATTFPAEAQELHYNSYHNLADTIELQSAAVLGHSGRAAEALVRELLAREDFPGERGPYLYFEAAGVTLRGLPLSLLLLLVAAPFAAVSWRTAGEGWGRLHEAWRRALPHWLSLWAPWVGSILLLRALVEAGLLDRYALYFATPKDPALTSPRWPAIGLYLAGLGFLFWACRRGAGRAHARGGPSYGDVRSLAAFACALTGLYILVFNPFSLLFLAPCLAWLWIGGRRGPGWWIDLVLFLAGGVVVYGLLYYFGFVILRIGWAVLWYVLNMFSIPMVNFPTALVVGAILASGLSLIIRPAAAG